MVGLAPERHLVLHSTEHLPPGFKERFGAWIDWTWAFVLRETSDGRTRFVFRSRVRLGPKWLAGAYWAAVVPADFVMSRQMLHGIRRRSAHPLPARDQEVGMTPDEKAGTASPISKPLSRCPKCGSTRLDPVVENAMQEVHFLCRDCARCWDVALGTVTRVAPPSCFGCPERGRCEQVYAADHPSPRSCIAPEGQPIG